MRISLDGVDAVIDDQPILGEVTLRVASGEFHGLIGPNGSGKSTLLRCLYRALRPRTGAIRLGEEDLWRELAPKEAARRRAVVTQDATVDPGFTVTEVVLLGRAPHKGMFERDSANDLDTAEAALAQVGMSGAAHRSITTLSGGERQRVLLARALAQQAPILLLDEPTNHLDVRSQLEVLELARTLGLTTLAALHDLDQAAAVCDGVTVLSGGRVVASGPPGQILTPELIRQVFGVRAVIDTHPLTGRPHVMVALDGDPAAPAATAESIPDPIPDHQEVP